MTTSEIRLSFGDVVPPLVHAGYSPRDILPLIPPGALLSEASRVQEDQLGKTPGRYSNGVWSGLSGEWPMVGLDAATIASASNWPTQNVGLRAADFPSIDIDTSTAEALAFVERVVHRVVPGSNGAPVRMRGNAPRALYVFQLADDAEPIQKSRVAWQDASGNKHAVDILGLGQQYAIAGVHPSGTAYEWRNGKDLASVSPDTLPALTRESLTLFLSALTEEIEATGGMVISSTKGSGARGAKIDFHNADPEIDPAIALGALRAIPNNPDTLPAREDLVALLASFKAATGREADALYPDVLEWATRHGWADEEYVTKIWDSLTVSHVPHDHLISMARKHGWRGDAVLDFKTFGPDDYEIIATHSSGPLTLFAPEKAKPDLAATAETLRRHAPGLVALDEMAGDMILMRPLRGEPNFAPRPLTEADVLVVQEALQRGGLRRVGKDTVVDALSLIADGNRFHPVRDYLRGLKWDGVERVTRLFPRYFGSEDNEYTREVGRMMLIGMIARVMRPPVKVDNTVVLEGRQRTRKSTAVEILGGKWYSDHLPPIESKDASIHLRGRWVVEIPEMKAVGKADANTQKSFMTRTTERFRRPFGRREVEEPRQNIFIGTTNEKEYLRDATGGRRWWPIRVGMIDTDALARDRNQIFAEALVRFERGEKWYAEGDFEDRVLAVEQEARFEADPWEEPIADFVHGQDHLTTAQIALGAIGLTAGLVHAGVSRRIADIMRRLGWEQHKDRRGGRTWRKAGGDGR